MTKASKAKKILVTGGAGFIGSHLVQELAKNNQVKVIDSKVGSIPSVEYLIGDYVSICDCDLSKIDTIIHLAWRSTPASGISLEKEFSENVEPTCEFVRRAKKNGVHNFIFLSSAGAVYGKCDSPCLESQPLKPVSNYGKGKMAVEEYLCQIASKNFRVTVLRPTNVIGLGQKLRLGQGLIPAIIHSHLTGERLVIRGNAKKDYLAVTDLVNAIELSLAREVPWSVYNIGSGQLLSTKQIVELSESVWGKPLNVTTSPRKKTDPQRVEVSIAKIKEELGWQPKVEIESLLTQIFVQAKESMVVKK